MTDICLLWWIVALATFDVVAWIAIVVVIASFT